MSPTRKLLILGCMLLLALPLYAQGNYYLSRIDTLPTVQRALGESDIPLPVNHEDVKAIGSGRTYIANGRAFNGMLYNPALLAHSRISFDLLNVQVSVPKTTIDAASFIQDHKQQFDNGDFLKIIDEGVDNFNA